MNVIWKLGMKIMHLIHKNPPERDYCTQNLYLRNTTESYVRTVDMQKRTAKDNQTKLWLEYLHLECQEDPYGFRKNEMDRLIEQRDASREEELANTLLGNQLINYIKSLEDDMKDYLRFY